VCGEAGADMGMERRRGGGRRRRSARRGFTVRRRGDIWRCG
jgi:hypothetical protein